MEVQSILAAKGTGVMTTRPGAKIGAVIRKMRLEKVGALVVSDDGERVQGLITERDSVPGSAEGGGLGGIISIGDVVKNRLEAVALESNVLRDAYLATS